MIEDKYLGDGVYASFDGYHIVLDLRGQDNTTKIGLEPNVLDALEMFRRKINECINLCDDCKRRPEYPKCGKDIEREYGFGKDNIIRGKKYG